MNDLQLNYSNLKRWNTAACVYMIDLCVHFLPRYTYRLKICNIFQYQYCMPLVKLFNTPDTNFKKHTPHTCAISCETTV